MRWRRRNPQPQGAEARRESARPRRRAASSPLSAAQAQARILAEALPYMQRYSRQTVIVKFGGHAMGEPELAAAFAQDIVLLKQSGVNPIVVHGGGPQIAGMLKRLQLKSEFVNGLRVTDKPTVEVVEMVLAGPDQQGHRHRHQPRRAARRSASRARMPT